MAAPGHAAANEVKVWATGAYSFSDELGGFRITGASGIGTKDDPLVITEELNSATPVTLTIRGEAFQVETPRAANTDKLLEAFALAKSGVAAA